ncbi:MAG: glycosyltransferase family A protein [Planctomycetota bacterium]
MIGVVIPAHNEAAVIGECLDALLADAGDTPIEVVVVCNACTDDTAQRAVEAGSRHGTDIRVIETETPGKVNALNLGDAACGAFPRCYLDADVRVGPGSVRAVAEALGEPDCHAAAPRMVVDAAEAPWTVRRFFDAWVRTGYHRQGMIGSGFFAMSEAGRSRFEAFPDIIADDAFARCQFRQDERRVLDGSTFTVRAPRTFWSLVKIKTRSHLGNLELAAKYPDIWAVAAGGPTGLPRREFLLPHRWPSTLVYAAVKLISRFRSHRQFRKREFDRWERDETTRGGQTGPPRAADRPGGVVTPIRPT